MDLSVFPFPMTLGKTTKRPLYPRPEISFENMVVFRLYLIATSSGRSEGSLPRHNIFDPLLGEPKENVSPCIRGSRGSPYFDIEAIGLTSWLKVEEDPPWAPNFESHQTTSSSII